MSLSQSYTIVVCPAPCIDFSKVLKKDNFSCVIWYKSLDKKNLFCNRGKHLFWENYLVIIETEQEVHAVQRRIKIRILNKRMQNK